MMVALSLAYSASAGHSRAAQGDTYQCDHWLGYLSNNQSHPLAYYNISWSNWDTVGGLYHDDYRQDGSQNTTYFEYTNGHDQTTTSTGNDAFLQTYIVRGGYSSDQEYVDEWSHNGCG
jgi:hypothetical protein